MRATRITNLLLAGFVLAGAASPAKSQVQDTKVMTLSGAKGVVAAAVAEAQRLGAGGAIAVVDEGGYLLALERLDGTFPAAAEVALGKARTAAIFRKETRAFEDAIKNGRTSLTAVPPMLPLQGGVPILFEGRVVGAVGVSGAMSAQQDEEIAKVAAEALASGRGSAR